MKEREINRQVYYASPIMHNGYPALLIRKIISDKATITAMARDILETGVHEINGVLVFRNPITAINHLHQLGLIDFTLAEFFEPDFSKKK